MKPLLALLCCCLPCTLWGWEVEDFSLRRDYLELENHLDFRAYQLTTRQRLDWATTRNGFAGSLGSISMERFYHDTELRISKEPAPWLEVYLRQRQTEFAGPQTPATEVGLLFGGLWQPGARNTRRRPGLRPAVRASPGGRIFAPELDQSRCLLQ